MSRLVIGVDGIDGSGKTCFGARLLRGCARHGVRVAVIGVDEFRRPRDWRQPGRRESDIYYEEYYDLVGLDGCVGRFRNGNHVVRVPVYDPVAERVTGVLERDLRGTEVLVVEGVFVQRMPTVRGSFVIYLRTSLERAVERIVARDLARARPRAEIERRIRERYLPSQLRYFLELAPERRAHMVIDNDDYASPRLVREDAQALPPRLRRVLAGILA
jgi:uridine kinase